MNPIISMTASGTAVDCQDTRAAAVIEAVRSGRWREPVERIREMYRRVMAETGDAHKAKDAVAGLKKRLPGVLPSGRFTTRANGVPLVEKLTAHSGLLGADLDLLGDRLPTLRAQLTADPHVYALSLSPTATGLKVWFRVRADASQHADSFAAVLRHCQEYYAVEVDPACKDVPRLCFVSHDPDAYLNRDAIELPPLEETPKAAPAPVAQSATRNGALPPSVQALLDSGVTQGQRNDRCLWLAAQLRDAGFVGAQAESYVLTYAGRCQPPLSPAEARGCLHSAFSRPAREPAHSPSACPETPEIESALQRLAALSRVEYDRCRGSEAERLNIRLTTLDDEVEARRPQKNSPTGSPMEFTDLEPWSQPVDGAALLAEICALLRRYVVASAAGFVASALFVLHTYAFDLGDISPMLFITGPTKRCGKSRLLSLLARLVHRALAASSASAAGIYRTIELHRPTLLIDEVDSFLKGDEQLRGLINSGHTRDAAFHLGCVAKGDDFEPRRSSTWTPKVLSGTGRLADTLEDRAIILHMRRRRKDEAAERLRHGTRFDDLRRKCARFIADNEASIRTANPNIPDALNDRATDNWTPLLALADLAGGEWPAKARQAALELSGSDGTETLGTNAQLLADIERTFSDAGIDRLASKELCERLADIEGRP